MRESRWRRVWELGLQQLGNTAQLLEQSVSADSSRRVRFSAVRPPGWGTGCGLQSWHDLRRLGPPPSSCCVRQSGRDQQTGSSYMCYFCI